MRLKGLFKNISGATGIEYGMIGGLLSIAIVAGVTVMGTSLDSNFSMIGSTFGAAEESVNYANNGASSGTGGSGFNPADGAPSLPTSFVPQLNPNLLVQNNSLFTPSVPTSLGGVTGTATLTSTSLSGGSGSLSLNSGSSGPFIPNNMGPFQQ